MIQDATNPLLNHAVGDVLPAGSVFKLVTGVGALNEGVVTPDQILETPPKLEVTEKYYANDPGKAPVAVPGILRLLFELVLFAFATWALFDASFETAAWILGIVVALHYISSYDRILWIIKQ